MAEEKKSSYWERRAASDMFEYMQSAEKTADQIAKVYLKASRYLSFEADDIFDKYKGKYGLSEQEAMRLINTMQDKTSINELLEKLRSEKDNEKKQELLKQLEAPAYQARLERLQQLQNQIDYIMRNVYEQERNFNTSHYIDLANEAYYKGIFNIQQHTGIGFSFNYVDAKTIDRIINSRWSGINYSDRIWKNTQALAQDLKEELLINLVTGRTNGETADIINEKYAAGASAARRLIRTESNYVASELNFKAYEECGIEKYCYVAILDLRTSKICRELDRKIFKTSDKMQGVNAPPMHPWCRSTTIGVITEELLNQLTRTTRNPATGEIVKIPASMSYQDWYNKYVKGKPEAELEEKKIKNCSSDKRQHKKYREILGDEVPEKLDDFQRMKYTESEKWNAIKLSFRKNSNANTSFAELKEPMQLKHVKKVLSDMGIDFGNTKIKIDRRYELLGKGLYGWTNPNLKEIQLYPDAFTDREQLVKTLGHERIHVEQVRVWGIAKTHEDAIYYEKGPEFSEEYWWKEYVRRTGYVNR